MMRNKLIVSIVLIVCCLLLGRSIGNTAENVSAIGVNILNGSINGTCFNDVNQDGQMNQGEQGIPGVTVTLKRFYLFEFSYRVAASTQTDAEGKYTFSVNRAGFYRIEETDPPDSISTTPNAVVFFIGVFNKNRVILFGDILDSSQPTVSITADPPVILKGSSCMLNWSSENADTVTIDQGIGEVQAVGSLEVFPQGTTTYTITAVGKGGTAQSSITVTVQNIVTTTSTIPNPPPGSTTTTSTSGGGGKSTTTTTTIRSTTTTTVQSTTTTTANSSTTTTATPTAIELSSFSAVPDDKEIKLIWKTETENDNAGFNVYRAEAEDGTYLRLGVSLIPAQGSTSSGALYTYTDRDVVNRKTYFYKLEDIDINGAATSHGPVSATPLFMYRIK